MKVAVLHDQVAATARPDELDTLVQAQAVGAALTSLGHEWQRVEMGLDLLAVQRALADSGAEAIFNLVEAVGGQARLIHVAPAWLDALGLPYTGAPTEAIFLSTNKLLAKGLLRSAGIRTPAWLAAGANAPGDLPLPGRFIVKSAWEHASVGLDDDALIDAPDSAALSAALASQASTRGAGLFAEAFVDGREFNLSVLEVDGDPRVLPPAEIRFLDFPAGKPRIVGYRAKWEEDSFEYRHTVRSFEFGAEDAGPLGELSRLARQCWTVFGLRGYARVDFRVDEGGRPWVLEINANPCIATDAGFVAAASQAGLDYPALVDQLLQAACRAPCQVVP